MCGEAVDDPHRRQQESELEDESFDHADIAAETAMTNCGRVMFCMYNSFVTRNKVTHNQEHTKKCMILFMHGSILTNPVQV